MAILTDTKTWRRDNAPRPGTLTAEQAANVRAALEALAVRYQTPMALATALGATATAMWKMRSAKRSPSARTALMVAGVAGVGVDDVLCGRWPGDTCPHCGGTGKRMIR